MLQTHSYVLLLVSCIVVPSHVLGRYAQQASAVSSVQDDPKPVWHRNFVTEFNETTKLAFWSWQTNGKLTYAADQNAQRVDRENGRGDSGTWFADSINSHTPGSQRPATPLIITAEGVLQVGTARVQYQNGPLLSAIMLSLSTVICTTGPAGPFRSNLLDAMIAVARCCDEAGGCGILSPDWLANAEYVGQVVEQGELANEWTIRGLQPNNYFATADDSAVPLQLDQLPNDYITFKRQSFRKGGVTPSAFDLPEFACADKCPLTSVCTLLQMSGRLQTAWTGIRQGMFGTPKRLR